MAGNPTFTFVLGTRPEIIKLAPVIRQCEERGVSFSIIHTGQHYSDRLDSVFFEQLEIPVPDYNLGIGSKPHGQQTGEMLAGIEEVLLDDSPDTVLVQGDTNSVLAGAIATSKLDSTLGHVEAGLRSFDRDMPEELNRILADHAADYLFAPTKTSRDLLQEEGITDDRVHVTGNTVVDAVHQNRKLASEKSDILPTLELRNSNFGLMTAHRAENVDDSARFRGILSGVEAVATELGLEFIYPIHPRAEEQLGELDIDIPDPITVIEPQNYLDFLVLEAEADLIVTDSGGVQEEACILGVPCVTVRDNTERPETISVGANTLAGTDPDDILASARQMISTPPNWETPFGDGTAAEQIVRIVTGA